MAADDAWGKPCTTATQDGFRAHSRLQKANIGPATMSNGGVGCPFANSHFRFWTLGHERACGPWQ